MAEIIPPKQAQLSLAQFPQESWAVSLVSAFNQFSVQVVNAFKIAAPKYKVLSFTTGAAVADSFPIDFPVETAPSDVRVAMVVNGAPSGAVTVVAQVLSGGKLVRVSSITGLSINTTYSIRLAME